MLVPAQAGKRSLIGTEKALTCCSVAFSRRKPASTLLENALDPPIGDNYAQIIDIVCAEVVSSSNCASRAGNR